MDSPDILRIISAAGIEKPISEMNDADWNSVQDYLERSSLIPFTQRMFPRYRPSRHHRLIAQALEQVARKQLRYVVITMPPRHGKSELASVHFPAWYLGNYPDERIIAVSYSAGLVNRFSRRARDIVDHPKYPFEGITLSQTASSVTMWDINERRGGYIAAGVGGGITGMGANVLLIDDPVKNQEEADSPVMRENVWEWFTSTALTRLEPNGAVILIGTRWHEDDLIGRALQMEDIDWTTLYLPAEADSEEDILNRKPGQWLWPERFSEKEYREIKKRVGERNWLTQYQGRPFSDTGNIFQKDWWRYYTPGDRPQFFQQACITVDSAFKSGVGADYSVFALWAKTYDYNYYLLDLVRGRWEFPDLISMGYDLYAQWRAQLNVPLAMVVEDQASGQSAIQTWMRTDQKTGRPPLNVIPYKTRGQSKIARADGITNLVQAHRVFIPQNSWTDEFVTEHVAFPYGMHDDQVDTTSMALSFMALGEFNTIAAY